MGLVGLLSGFSTVMSCTPEADRAPEPSGGSSAAGGPSATGPFADVTRVLVSGDAQGYTFDVSVMSSDLDCSHYVNYWEVLTDSGELLYRRGINHSHTDENGTSDSGAPGNTFTRSGGPVPAEPTQTVLVRAHLFPFGYVGQVLRGTPAGAFSVAFDLPDGFAAALEDAPPEPPPCQF